MDLNLNRRRALRLAANGFGLAALQGLLAEQSSAAVNKPHFAARAKSVIFLFMDGGVSHVDSFDPKPELTKRHGEVFKDSRKWVRSPWKFTQHGQSGLPISELFPHIAKHADELCVIRSMKADLPIHSTGVLLMHRLLWDGGSRDGLSPPWRSSLEAPLAGAATRAEGCERSCTRHRCRRRQGTGCRWDRRLRAAPDRR